MDLDEFIEAINSLRDAYKQMTMQQDLPQEEYYKLKNALTEIKMAVVSMEASLAKKIKSNSKCVGPSEQV